jgi:hypothetical protein
MAIERRWGLDSATYVYDATTHALVGEEYATDVNTFTCGADRVFKLHGGTFPTCAASSTTSLCPGEGGPDATPDAPPDTGLPDSDGSSCTCVVPDAGPPLSMTSLPCYCASYPCPAFDVAVHDCPGSVNDAGFNALSYQNYASCGLVAIQRNIGLDISVYVYDAVTHDLVGVDYRKESAAYTCGAAHVPRILAGTLPGTSCVATTTTLCTDDGGTDAGGD